MPAYDPRSRAEKAARQNGKPHSGADASTSKPPLAPNKEDISKHLYALFDPTFVQPHQDAWIEVAYGLAATGGAVHEARNFSVFDLQEAAEFAEAQNIAGYNIYVGPALRQGEWPPDGRASDKHVVTSAYAWIEYDGAGDDERVQRTLRELTLHPRLIVTTGTVPYLRRHLYFKLDGTVTPEQLRAANTALRDLLDSDAVQNPGRVMRLAGTVNYPPPKKQDRGYVAELVTLKTQPGACSSKAEHLIETASILSGETSHGRSNSENGPRSDDKLIELLRVSQGTSKWHNALLSVTASMVGRGWQDLAIRLSCAPYCKGGASDPELNKLIQDARKKFNKPDPGAGAGKRSAPNASVHSWDDPDWSIFDDRRGDLPDFPLDVLTPAWQELLLRSSHGAGVRPEHVAIPLLGVASSLIGTARRISPSRSWSEPMTMWACVVANSGDRKTPGLNVTIRVLDLIEQTHSADVSKKRLAHETLAQKAKEAMKKWKDEREAALDAVPPKDPPIMPLDAIDPGDFIEPRLYATDPTIERLAALLQARPRGMMLIRDELAGLFANMGRYSGGSDRPFWLEAWNGRRHVVERQSGSVAIPHLLVGVIGSFQPDKLARAFAGDEDGMYGRFLYAWPSTPEYRPLSNDADEFEPDLQNALTALIRLPSEDADGMFYSKTISLSPDAVAEFEAFRIWSDQTKRGLDGHELHWFVKGETTALRLAGTLAYMAWAMARSKPSASGYDSIVAAMEPEVIDKQFVAAAIRLWRDFFWPHARAALRQIGLTDRHKDARIVLRWIKVRGKSEVSAKDVRRHALAQRLDAQGTHRLLDELQKSGWLKKHTTETAGRPKHRWVVNPKLALAPPEEPEEGEGEP